MARPVTRQLHEGPREGPSLVLHANAYVPRSSGQTVAQVRDGLPDVVAEHAYQFRLSLQPNTSPQSYLPPAHVAAASDAPPHTVLLARDARFRCASER